MRARRTAGGRLFLVAGILVGALSPPAVARAEDPLRLEDAVNLALANNERAKKVPLRIEVAEGGVDRARDAFYPNLTANGTGTLRGRPPSNASAITENATMTLSQPLLTPSAFPLYRVASHQLESEKWGAAQDRRLLAFDTARTFLQTLAIERLSEAAIKQLERARANLDNAAARAQAQLASTNDVTRAQIDLSASERALAGARGNLERAYLSLGFLLGRSVTGPLAPTDRTSRAAQQVESAAPDQIRAAQGRRADVRSARERTESLRISATEPLYRLAPSLSAAGQLRLTPDPQQPTEKPLDETVTLNLTWNIFDGGFRYADRRTRLAQADSQALDEALLRRSVETDVQLALASLRAAKETFRHAEEGVAAAQRNIEETEILYRQGLARAIEVTDANGKGFDADVARASAKLAMEQAYLELRFALGFGPLDDDPQGTR